MANISSVSSTSRENIFDFHAITAREMRRRTAVKMRVMSVFLFFIMIFMRINIIFFSSDKKESNCDYTDNQQWECNIDQLKFFANGFIGNLGIIKMSYFEGFGA